MIMKRYAAVIFSVSLALAAAGLVSGVDSVTTAPSVDSEVSDSTGWSPSVENMVTRLVQNGMSNSGACPTSA
tara:strand:- start:17429 stop:17644 length:216 start_codon:yes stop_codon:yes gene_type:complete